MMYRNGSVVGRLKDFLRRISLGLIADDDTHHVYERLLAATKKSSSKSDNDELPADEQ